MKELKESAFRGKKIITLMSISQVVDHQTHLPHHHHRLMMAMVRKEVVVDQIVAHLNALIKNRTIVVIAMTVLIVEGIVLHNHSHLELYCTQRVGTISQCLESPRADLCR